MVHGCMMQSVLRERGRETEITRWHGCVCVCVFFEGAPFGSEFLRESVYKNSQVERLVSTKSVYRHEAPASMMALAALEPQAGKACQRSGVPQFDFWDLPN